MKKENLLPGFFIVLALSLLLLSGCTNNNRGMNNLKLGGLGRNPDKYVDVRTNFHTGTKGVTVKFVKDNPPLILYDTGNTDPSKPEIPLLLQVRNEGAYTPDAIYIYLTGFDPNIIGLPTRFPRISSLQGRSLFNTEGGIAMLGLSDGTEFGTGVDRGQIDLPPELDEFNPTIQALFCYDYETDASPTICVDPHPYTVTEQKACRVEDVKDFRVGGQGGPVAVTSVRPRMVPGKVIVEIGIRNSGHGKVVSIDSIGGNCPFGLGFSDMNIMGYEVTFNGKIVDSNSNTGRTTGSVEYGCQPSLLRLRNNAATLHCIFPINSMQNSAYQTVLNIKLKYGYLDYTEKQLRIKNIKRYG